MSQTSQEHHKNANLHLRETKNKILKYLYSQIDLDTKYEIISTEKDMDNIRDNEYIICPRFNGTKSWIIFFQSENNYYAVNFPKHNQRKKEDLKIHPVDINVTKEFYRGTIMEGVFFRMDKNRYLVVDEVYTFAGQNQLLKPKDDRLYNLSRIFKDSIMVNPNYQMYVSKYFSTNKKSLKELYETIKTDPKIQEIIFYPKIYGRKIYSYTILDIDLVDEIVKISNFRMQKTASPDVYKLISAKNKTKIGIAFIPDMETSKKCKQWFKDNKAKELLVKCQLDHEKNKWIPMEIVENDLDNSDNDDNDENDENSDNEDYVEV